MNKAVNIQDLGLKDYKDTWEYQEELFKEMDLDKDNSISLVEFKEIYKKHSLEHELENN